MVRFRFLNLLASLCTSHAANMFAAKNGSPVALQHPRTVSTSTQSTATHEPMHGFSHICDNTQGCTHALCPLAHRHLLQQLLSLSDPCRQQVILPGSDPRPLSRYRSLAATFALLETCAPVFWYCLHPCGPCTLVVQVYSAIH